MMNNKYKKALYLYGFYTLCHLIDQFEQEEQFEECKLILEALNEHNSQFNFNLPTKYDSKAKEYFHKISQEIGIKGNMYEQNLDYYASSIRKMK